MNIKVIENYSKLKYSLFLLPFLLLIAIATFLYINHATSVNSYLLIQKEYFFSINSILSQFPNTIFNLTQLGDALIVFSLLAIFFIKAPKLWEVLLSASIISALFSNIFKSIFSVPRPAAFYDTNTFNVIGKTLTGNNSLPSGHSITVFTTLTVLLFALMPKKWNVKIVWSLAIICFGLLLVLTRVGVGAHHPLDTIIGGIIGYISGISGIFISRKYKIWSWISNKKYYPIFILLFLVCCGVLVSKIIKENLIVFYFALISLIVSLYKIIYVYIKK